MRESEATVLDMQKANPDERVDDWRVQHVLTCMHNLYAYTHM